jgi:hypothetical protein
MGADQLGLKKANLGLAAASLKIDEILGVESILVYHKIIYTFCTSIL